MSPPAFGPARAWARSLLLLVALGAGTVATAQSGPEAASAGSIADRVAALIAEGDARMAEAEALRSEASVLAGEGPPDGNSDLGARRTMRADTKRAQADALEQAAEELWRQALALDPEAQDALLRRLRGSDPAD